MMLHPILETLLFTGFQKTAEMEFCDCVPDCIVLLKHGLWPASPASPVTALEIDMMDFLECLFLESQLSLKSFCSALKWKNVLSQRGLLVTMVEIPCSPVPQVK